MGVEACCTWGCSNKNKTSVSFRSTYTLDFNNSSFTMSDSENYETTFNHFLLRFLRYLCNFCPNTCSQEAILMKVSHLGVVTLLSTLDIQACNHKSKKAEVLKITCPKRDLNKNWDFCDFPKKSMYRGGTKHSIRENGTGHVKMSQVTFLWIRRTPT
jgi:hypothetical protein